MHSLIQHRNPVQPCTTTIQSRLAIKTQPQDKQRQRNTMYVHNFKCKSHADIPDCMIREEIRLTTPANEQLGILSEYVLHGWSSTKAKV